MLHHAQVEHLGYQLNLANTVRILQEWSLLQFNLRPAQDPGCCCCRMMEDLVFNRKEFISSILIKNRLLSLASINFSSSFAAAAAAALSTTLRIFPCRAVVFVGEAVFYYYLLFALLCVFSIGGGGNASAGY